MVEGFRPWSDEDDTLLAELVLREGKCWERIGSELKRSRYSCHKRYRLLRREARGQQRQQREDAYSLEEGESVGTEEC